MHLARSSVRFLRQPDHAICGCLFSSSVLVASLVAYFYTLKKHILLRTKLNKLLRLRKQKRLLHSRSEAEVSRLGSGLDAEDTAE